MLFGPWWAITIRSVEMQNSIETGCVPLDPTSGESSFGDLFWKIHLLNLMVGMWKYLVLWRARQHQAWKVWRAALALFQVHSYNPIRNFLLQQWNPLFFGRIIQFFQSNPRDYDAFDEKRDWLLEWNFPSSNFVCNFIRMTNWVIRNFHFAWL